VTGEAALRPVPRYAWLVFALTFGLLISDYMARQVLNAVFPLLKAEWALSDAQLGLLSGVVAVMVGLLTFPLSLLADRWGRVRSITVMALLWSVATLICAFARSYEQMLLGRILVGIGEAAYGSVGIAVVISVFPQRLRATLSAAFMAGGLFGQVLGVAVGGAVAAAYGWRIAFLAIAAGGLALALLYPLLVRTNRMADAAAKSGGVAAAIGLDERPGVSAIFATRSILCTYVGSGLQIYAVGALSAWLPTYLHRYYGLGVDRAGSLTGLLLLVAGAGMVACGMLSDRVARACPHRIVPLAIFYCLTCAVLLWIALAVPPGPAQLLILGFAVFVAAGTTGPAGAIVSNLTPVAIHGTAFATLTLANNLFGLAPGPIVTGRLADSIGLLDALRLLPLACLLAAAAFALALRSYRADLAAANA